MTDPNTPFQNRETLKIWRYTDGDWMMAVVPMDTPLEEFGGFRPFVEMWRGKCSDGRLPSWKDFDLLDFAGWYGWIMVFDVEARAPLRLKCRLWGSKVAQMFGYDLTGKYRELGEFGYNQGDDDFADALIAEKFIGYDEGVIYWQDRGPVVLRMLTFPLADDGENPDRLMHVHLVPEGLSDG